LRLKLKFFDARVKWLLHLRDYPGLETYVRQTFEDFEKRGLFNESTQAEKLKMLTYLINALYKNDKVAEATPYVERLGKEIEAYRRKYYDQYSFFYYNSLVYAYSRTQPLKAIEVLRFLKTSDVLKQNEFYTIFVYANLAYLLFEQKRYAEAAKEITQLYLTDVYKAAGEEFRYKVAVTECIIRFEMGEPDTVERRIEQIKREYGDILETNERERRFLELLNRLCNGIKPKTKKLAEDFLQRFPTAVGDEIIRYELWLSHHLRQNAPKAAK
jgi:tetratricopeptide (TPR) repeat protein